MAPISKDGGGALVLPEGRSPRDEEDCACRGLPPPSPARRLAPLRLPHPALLSAFDQSQKTDVHTVRLLFCDAAGIRRARAVPIPRGGDKGGGRDDRRACAAARASALGALATSGVGLTQACMGMPAHADMVAEESGLGAKGEVRLVPGRASVQQEEEEQQQEAPKNNKPARRTPPPQRASPPPALQRLLSPIRPLPWMPSHAVAISDMLDAQTGEPWACCPRAALRRVALGARRSLGVSFVVGFELEFVLLRPLAACASSSALSPTPFLPPGPPLAFAPAAAAAAANAPPPFHLPLCAADDLPYASSLALDAHADLLDEMVRACQSLGQGIVQFHSESAPGQYELALSPHRDDPVAACDGLLLAKEAVASLAARRGLVACFAPKPFADRAGSGMHVHVSVASLAGRGGGGGGGGGGAGAGEAGAGGGRNLMAANEDGDEEAEEQQPQQQHQRRAELGLSRVGESFVAGLLAHLPALLPFTAPSAGSYERLQPGCWAGAASACGLEDREAPLRVTGAATKNTNVEVKAIDATCNPHAALAAILTAGAMGLRERAALPPGGEADAGGPAPLPSSLPAALAALEADAALSEALQDGEASLGAPLFEALVGVRRCEARLGVTAQQAALRY
jgi:glutamine synthetase